MKKRLLSFVLCLSLETNLLVMMHTVAGSDTDLKTADLSACARAYLIDAGMKDAEVDALLARLTS